MVEKTRRVGAFVEIQGAIESGRNIVQRGREMRIGEVVLSAGARLTPPRLGLLASVGRVSVRVRPAPRVAIVATGDELVEPGQPLGPGQIRNSNAPMLRALAMAAGAEAHVLPIAADEPSALSTILRRGLDADVLLISGGVSAGTRDLVPSALAALGVENVFHKVNIKPGKPLWFGVGPSRESERGPLVFGLPGNPVSGLVGFLVFARPRSRSWRVAAKRTQCAGTPHGPLYAARSSTGLRARPLVRNSGGSRADYAVGVVGFGRFAHRRASGRVRVFWSGRPDVPGR